MKKISDIIKARTLDKDYRNTYEYQAYGNRLAEELKDSKHRALYIKLAKKEDRNILEKAREFALESGKTFSKGKLFMWKFSQLKKELNSADK